ncbi:OLC1v1037200C1 [Oldenlandia corymbosa var. corymbosa]|uniref:OLC1v1037200C1 n=1 Tax=Oldenlandia corymbosa var. corymbosa TaxID=529605 RepID=A0AAV1D0D5_OLDCO|nr:OLC1v1037200C1 [Oldenlandia corymbosa var. corymbosa]
MASFLPAQSPITFGTQCETVNPSKFTAPQIVKLQEVHSQSSIHYASCLSQISSLCKDGQLQEAADLLTEMELKNLNVGPDIYGELLQGCVYGRDLSLGQQFHSRIIKLGEPFSKNDFIETKLLILYAKCDLVSTSCHLFCRLGEKNVFSWAAIIGLYSRLGRSEDALLAFVDMHEDGILGDNFVVPNVLKACGSLKCIEFGRVVHGYLIKLGLNECVFVSSSLVDMYGKCAVLVDARKVFDGMAERNVVAWNSMIVSYVQNGFNQEAIELFYDMRVGDIEPTRVTVSSFLSASANLCAVEEGKQGHALAILNGLPLDIILGSSVVNFYAKVGLFEDAERVFHRIVEKDVVTWNLLISSYLQYGFPDYALSLCRQMRIEGFMFDSITLSSILTTSADMRDVRLGKEGHCYCIRNHFDPDVVVASSIVDMYAKCERIQDARRVFDSTAGKDTVLWNTMLSAYAELGLAGETMKLFYQMQLDEVPQNVVSRNLILLGFLRNGQVSEAIDMFSEMVAIGVEPNLVTYTTLISGLSQNGHGHEAIMMLQQMLRAGFLPNVLSLCSALSACADIASLRYGRAIHGYFIRRNLPFSVSITTALVDMYSKCGSLRQAKHIFDITPSKELPSYNVMISAYALHGNTKDALALYKRLQDEGIKPDSITYTKVLSSCSHGGLVHEAFKIIHDMVTLYSLRPTIEHYGCIITLLSRLGNLQEVLELIQTLPIKPDSHIWVSLLAACRELNETQLGETISNYLISTEPANAGSYVTVSNAYATVGRWSEVLKSRDLMKQKGIRKSPGCSWIQIGAELHVFVARDIAHPDSEKIYSMLALLEMDIRQRLCFPFL